MRRRDVLKLIPAGLASLALPFGSRRGWAHPILERSPIRTMLNPMAETDKVLVLLWLNGGNDGLNTVIPYQNAEYDKNRKNTGFTSASDKQRLIHNIRDDLALNPAMATLFPHWKDGKLAI